MSQPTSRQTAIEILVERQKTRKPVRHIFDTRTSVSGLSTQDSQLTMKIVYGVLRHKQDLDAILQKLCRQPLNKIKNKVYQALLVGLYQLFFLDRIPDSAAVNETVNGLKKLKVHPRLVGFTNGVLRESIRQRASFPIYHGPKNSSDILNHPLWLTKRWSSNYGKNTMINICRHNTSEPVLSLRVNNSKISRDSLLALFQTHNISADAGKYSPSAVILKQPDVSLQQLPGFTEGYFQVQDQAAQLASILLGPYSADTLCLDGCAGLGGKTTHLAELLNDAGNKAHQNEKKLVAIEPELFRYNNLKKNLERLSLMDLVSCSNLPLAEFAEQTTTLFDKVLIDVPCSGTGVTGKHPDIRWNREEKDILNYTRIQKELLQTASRLVNEGGTLVYATCSIEPEENFQIIEHFLTGNHSFTLSPAEDYLPASASTLVRENCFAPLPNDEIDGFFAARLVRKTN